MPATTLQCLARLAGRLLFLLCALAAPAAHAQGLAEALAQRTGAPGFEKAPAAGETIAAAPLIARLYAARGHRPAWDDPARRAALLARVEASRDDGLDPEDYHREALLRLRDVAPADLAAQVDRELVYTDALARLAYHLYFGKAEPRSLQRDWNYGRSLGNIEPLAALEQLLTAPDLAQALDGYAPQLALYRSLRTALARTRALAALGDVPPIGNGPTMKPGESGERVARLRQRLVQLGDLKADPGPETTSLEFDGAVEEAVRRFQIRHGLDADGAVGRQTREALDVPLARRADALRVNLERLRWVARDLTGDYLLVDVAGFTARLVLDGQLAWSSRIIVGRPYRKTPAFRATMESLVLNPVWTVPPTILRQDVAPKALANPGYLAKEHLHVLGAGGKELPPGAVDWAAVKRGAASPRVVQPPGPENPLGALKFLLPNPHSIYLHDTPSRRLFNGARRAFSSGCIRLEDPRALAVLLLDDEVHWNAATLDAAIATGETRSLPLKRRVPVLFLYFTASVDEGGAVHFRPDLYGADGAVLKALGEPFRFVRADRTPRG